MARNAEAIFCDLGTQKMMILRAHLFKNNNKYHISLTHRIPGRSVGLPWMCGLMLSNVAASSWAATMVMWCPCVERPGQGWASLCGMVVSLKPRRGT